MNNPLTPVEELQPCPFCGNENTPVIWDSSEARDDWEDSMLKYYQVVCDASDSSNGCGGSGGWQPDRQEAVATWNKRVYRL